MKKLLFIPRAIIDIISLWTKQLTIKEKSSLTCTLTSLKIKKWFGKRDELINYPLFGCRFYGINNEALQFLIKEIFVEKIYAIKREFEHKEVKRIVDAGANTGLSVLFFKRFYPNTSIEAYEPNESSFDILKKNIDENGIENVTLVKAAIAGYAGVLYPEDGFKVASVNQQFSPAGNKSKPVISLQLSKVLLQRADLVKLDIEGAELEVLGEIIESNCLAKSDCWVIEFHDEGEKRKDIINKFRECGFYHTCNKNVYQFGKRKQ